MDVRAGLEQVERGLAAGGSRDDALLELGFVAASTLALDGCELRGSLRRAVLLLAAGGDPLRPLALEARAVTALAEELDSPERRAALAGRLAVLEGEAEELPGVRELLRLRRADAQLALRAAAAGLLAAELAADD